MKKGLLFFFCFLIVFSKLLSGQTYPNQVSPGNNFQEAYRTNGYKVANPDPNELYNWETEVQWQEYKKQTGWQNIPGHAPFSGKNQVYLEISTGNRVYLSKPLKFENKHTIVVCGDLKLANITMDVSVPMVNYISNSNITNGIRFNGEFESVIEVSAIGVWFKPKVEGSSFWDTPSEQIESVVILQNGFYPFYIDLSYDLLTAGVVYEFVVVAQNAQGMGYSFIQEGVLEPGKTILWENLETKDDVTVLNNVTLIVCETGSFQVTTLAVNNSANLNIDGVFYVEDIISAGGIGAGPCIWGTGTLINPNPSHPNYPAPGLPDNIQYGTATSGTSQACGSDNSPSFILPINLLSFSPEVKPDRIELNWVTGTEINNDYFTLERSCDIYGWEVLGFMEGAGNSTVSTEYSFSDLQPLDGLAYYRLKQTDFDGAFKYYGPIAVHYYLGLEGLEFKVMKNYSGWLIAVPTDGMYKVEVYSLQGHLMHSERVENTLSIPAPEGAVVIRVTDGFERNASRVVM